jgi:hypothetical protein
MAGDDPWLERRKVSFNNVQVGSAHAARLNLDQHMTWFEPGTLDLLDRKPLAGSA